MYHQHPFALIPTGTAYPPGSPVRTPGFVENVSSVSPACRKRRLIGAVCRNNRKKNVGPVSMLGRAR